MNETPQNTLAPCPQECPHCGSKSGVRSGRSGDQPETEHDYYCEDCSREWNTLAPCPIKDEGEETKELGKPEAPSDHAQTVLLKALQPLFDVIEFHEQNTPETEGWRRDSTKVEVRLGDLRLVRILFQKP